ncbi:class I adenylate-forming enzyme family protein [Mesorhizobium abyssinicae]|uniref:class I adenylate-forming enzyme family protein n=1 Tax=Mesorhizobium abyssinicae TaxID=1209958 RepID=UPI00339B30A5
MHGRTFASSETSVAWLLGGEGLPAGIDPAKEALTWVGGSLSYAELRRSALAMARALRESGLRVGDTVLCHMFNRGEMFQVYFACAFAGLRMIPASFRLAPAELRTVVEESNAKLIFTEERLADVAKIAIENIAHHIDLIELATMTGGPLFDQMTRGEVLEGPFERTDPHIILFSSGTTGKPKGIMLNHSCIMNYAFQQIAVWPGYNADMRLLVTPAMFNTGGINEITIPTFLVGGTVCIMPSKGWKAERMSELIDLWQITHAVIFPTMIVPLLEADGQVGVGLETLRVAITGGEACPPEKLNRFRNRWPHVNLLIGYGMTEGGLVSFIGGEEMDKHPYSVGRVTIGQAVKIADAAGTTLPTGSVGEIMTAGPGVMSGYLNSPELTGEALRGGWLKTGDLGRMDEDGYLYIEGRSRDMIISKGQNIFPAEIESALLRHPSVRLAAVVGVPDPEFGEAVCAVIVLHEGHSMTEDEVKAYVGEHIASYKKPRHVRFHSNLPVGTSNKVQKRELAAAIAAEMNVASASSERSII